MMGAERRRAVAVERERERKRRKRRKMKTKKRERRMTKKRKKRKTRMKRKKTSLVPVGMPALNKNCLIRVYKLLFVASSPSYSHHWLYHSIFCSVIFMSRERQRREEAVASGGKRKRAIYFC